MTDDEIAKVQRAVRRAPKWRLRWQTALVALPIGVALNVALWALGLYPDRPWWRPALAALGVWLAMALACKLAERWYVRQINRIIKPWRVTKVTR